MNCPLDGEAYEIDARNPAAEAICQVARRTTDSAADAQNVIGGGHMERIRQFPGRLQTATVEMVEGRQRLDGRAVRIDAVID